MYVWINRDISLSAFFAPENLVSRDGFGSPVPRQPAHLHNTQAECGACLRDSSGVPRRRPFIYFKPPYAIGSVPSLSGHAIAYQWRSLPRVRRHRASKPQGSYERVLPWQVTMDQLICDYLSHTHYWYEVGMLKVLLVNPMLLPSGNSIKCPEEFLTLQPMFLPTKRFDVSPPSLGVCSQGLDFDLEIVNIIYLPGNYSTAVYYFFDYLFSNPKTPLYTVPGRT